MTQQQCLVISPMRFQRRRGRCGPKMPSRILLVSRLAIAFHDPIISVYAGALTHGTLWYPSDRRISLPG